MKPDEFFIAAITIVYTLCWLASGAWAQNWPAYESVTDELTIEDGPTENTAVVTYRNSQAMSSNSGEFVLTAPNGVTVTATITINVDEHASERITIDAGDEHTAWPVEADVRDGDEVTIQIIRPMS